MKKHAYLIFPFYLESTEHPNQKFWVALDLVQEILTLVFLFTFAYLCACLSSLLYFLSFCFLCYVWLVYLLHEANAYYYSINANSAFLWRETSLKKERWCITTACSEEYLANFSFFIWYNEQETVTKLI